MKSAMREAGALLAQGRHERPDRNVDRERPHQVVEFPVRIGLHLVVAIDAALLAREGRIDGAELELIVDCEMLESGLGSILPTNDSIVFAISASDGGVAISRPARPTQRRLKSSFAADPLVEFLDRMRAEGRRHRERRRRTCERSAE